MEMKNCLRYYSPSRFSSPALVQGSLPWPASANVKQKQNSRREPWGHPSVDRWDACTAQSEPPAVATTCHYPPTRPCSRCCCESPQRCTLHVLVQGAPRIAVTSASHCSSAGRTTPCYSCDTARATCHGELQGREMDVSCCAHKAADLSLKRYSSGQGEHPCWWSVIGHYWCSGLVVSACAIAPYQSSSVVILWSSYNYGSHQIMTSELKPCGILVA